MGDLKARLQQEMRDALRAGQKVRLGALRMLSASVKNREVELRREVTDEEFAEVARREVKRRREAAEAYESAGRQDLLDKEREEEAVLETYLPEQVSGDELVAMVEEAIRETGATGLSDLGKVMARVMGNAGGRVDGAAASAVARQRLGEIQGE